MSRFGILPDTLKEEIEKDPAGVYRRLRSLGFQGVEGPPPDAAGEDMPVTSGLSIGWGAIPGAWDYFTTGKAYDSKAVEQSAATTAQQLKDAGASYGVIYWGPCDSRDQIMREVEVLNAFGRGLAAEGVKLCYHNHDHEFVKPVEDGVRGMDLLIEHLEKDAVFFQLDLGWVRYGKEDPAALLRKLAGRVPVVHLRDVGNPEKRGEFVVPCIGVIDMADVFAACSEAGVDWIILEPQKSDHFSPWDVITASAVNLLSKGLITR